jgi:hypothetical protein
VALFLAAQAFALFLAAPAIRHVAVTARANRATAGRRCFHVLERLHRMVTAAVARIAFRLQLVLADARAAAQSERARDSVVAL